MTTVLQLIETNAFLNRELKKKTRKLFNINQTKRKQIEEDEEKTGQKNTQMERQTTLLEIVK